MSPTDVFRTRLVDKTRLPSDRTEARNTLTSPTVVESGTSAYSTDRGTRNQDACRGHHRTCREGLGLAARHLLEESRDTTLLRANGS